MKKLQFTSLLLLSILFLFCGCAGKLKGPLFQPVSDLSADKALIYLYWPDENLNTHFNIEANGKSITTLKNGGYFTYIAEPGEIELSAKVKFKLFASGILDVATSPGTKLAFTAHKGETYYVQCTGLMPKLLSLSMTRGQRLGMELVPEGFGRTKIQNCKLLAAK